MIMKLEIKHLAPYLPYGLEMMLEKSGDIRTLTGCYIESDELRFHFGIVNRGVQLWHYKPILRPLSELDVDFEVYTPEYLQQCCYSYVTYLISEHYDVFGLIDAGLAVDINTLDK